MVEKHKILGIRNLCSSAGLEIVKTLGGKVHTRGAHDLRGTWNQDLNKNVVHLK